MRSLPPGKILKKRPETVGIPETVKRLKMKGDDIIGKLIIEPLVYEEGKQGATLTCRTCGQVMNLLNPFGPRKVDKCQECLKESMRNNHAPFKDLQPTQAGIDHIDLATGKIRTI